MPNPLKPIGLLIAFVHASAAIAQTQPDPSAGRWVKQGTYALSGFVANSDREETYNGASNEPRRLLSYLPQMTIVFPDRTGLIDSESVPAGYVAGITQTGTPVIVLDSQLSTAKFGSYPTHDVVVHREHLACPSPYCDLDVEGRVVGGGHSFAISEEGEGLIHLSQPEYETDLYYRAEDFSSLERSGQLTRAVGRTLPRWVIREGYSPELSLGCGGEHPAGTTFTVDAAAYESNPDTWSVNAPQWTVKAADLFVGSHVEKIDESYTVEITDRIHDVTKPADAGDDYRSAIDFTVFAYRDRDRDRDRDRPGNVYDFAVLISIVACERLGVFGAFAPSYVREAHLYFEDDSHVLPQQISEAGKEDLSTELPRSFMYSVNTPAHYEQLFDRLASGLSIQNSEVRANLVAVIMARLNATCSDDRRSTCKEIVDEHAVSAEAVTN